MSILEVNIYERKLLWVCLFLSSYFALLLCSVFYFSRNDSENHIEALLLQLSDCIYDGFGERDRAGSKFRRALLSEGNFWSHSF